MNMQQYDKSIPKHERPWGWFETIQEGEKYKVKKLFIKKGCRMSLQSHDQRDEHWVVISGFGNVELEDVERFIGILSTCIYPDQVFEYPMKEEDLHLGPPTTTNFSYGYAKRSLAVQIDALTNNVSLI